MQLKKILKNTTSYLGQVSTAILVTGFLVHASAYAQEASQAPSAPSAGSEVLLQADKINYNDSLNIITASGNVELLQNGRVIVADKITYNQASDTITATGDVKILEPDGTVLFAEYSELTNQMSKGTLHKIRLLLEDNARVAANGARRHDENTTELAKAVYSPCELCKEDPDKPPLWQVKSKKIIHDKEEKTLRYYDSWLEMAGLPVAYLPFLQTPDPSVKRASGILPPTIGSNSSLGLFYQQPYFWAISEDKDATFEPIFTADGGIVLAGQYRQALDNGNFEIDASIVDAPDYYENNSSNKGHTRWHVDTEGQFQLDEKWRAGFNLIRLSDRLYLDDYAFWKNPGNTADSDIYVEGIENKNYTKVEARYWQDLRASPSINQPKILPSVLYSTVGPSDNIGGNWFIDSSLRNLDQAGVSSSTRTSVKTGYVINQTTNSGIATRSSISMQGDFYKTDHENDATLDEDIRSRFIPRASMVARMPFVRNVGNDRQVIEPIAGLFIAPNSSVDQNIRNDDSLIITQDETSIFQEDLTPGIDRVEYGSRTSYGIKMAHYFEEDFEISGLIGQYYRFTENVSLFNETGIEDGASDYFGMTSVRPHEYVNVSYRFQIDQDAGDQTRSELELDIGSSKTYFRTILTDIDAQPNTTSTSTEELQLQAAVEIDDYWRTAGNWVHDLEDENTRSMGLSFIYEDECFIFDTSYNRSFTSDGSSGPDDTIMFTLTFKTLGEFNQSLNNGS